MNKYNFVFIVISLLCMGAIAKAETVIKTPSIIAICSDINGPETRYFSKSYDDEYKENKFYDQPSSISNQRIVFVWEQDIKTAEIALIDEKSETVKISTRVSPVNVDLEQLTFSGVWNDAPIMFSLYPRDNVAILTQHSTHSVAIGQGVRAFMFHSKCLIDLS